MWLDGDILSRAREEGIVRQYYSIALIIWTGNFLIDFFPIIFILLFVFIESVVYYLITKLEIAHP